MRLKQTALAGLIGMGVLGLGSSAGAAPKPKLTIDNPSVVEGNAGTTTLTFTVTLSAASAKTVTVGYSTLAGTATSPADFIAASGTISFAPGVTTRPIAITVVGDVLDEANETFTVRLQKPSGATVGGGGRGTGTITNDDTPPTVSIADVTVGETDSGSANASFVVTLSNASGRTVTMNYATAAGTTNPATAGVDYVSTTGALSFTPGATSRTITVPVFGDTLDEADETFVVNLSALVNTSPTGNDLQALGTIQDNDGLPSLSIDDVVKVEGNAGASNASFTVTLSPASGRTVTVSYATANGTASPATAGSDYTATTSTLTFAAGVTTQTINVSVLGDASVESNETFFVNLSSPTNASIADSQGLGTIIDDDGTPAFSISDLTAVEGSSGTTSFTFTISLAPVSGSTTTVDWATADGTATAGSDYTAVTATTVTFNAGDGSKTVTVDVAGDTLNEPNETFFVNLSNATGGANLGRVQATGSITNDDAAPSVSVGNASLTEGDGGTANMTFAVSLSAASGQAVTLNYATADGTALQPGDYTDTAGTLTFAPGTTSLNVDVPIVGDLLNEANETFAVNLTNIANASAGTTTGTGIIDNDDPLPSLAVDDPSSAEGDTPGDSDLTFTVTLTPASGQTVSVDYATANGTATTANGDYTAIATTALTFLPGETTKTVQVAILGDTAFEQNETVNLNLSGPTNANVGDSQGVGTILNDDGFFVTLDDVAVDEGDSGPTSAVFTVSLSDTDNVSHSVDVTTAAGTATANVDYTPLATTTVTFAAGEQTKTVAVSVLGDRTAETDETFYVDLANATGPTITIFDGRGLGTIADDDPPAGIVIGNANVTEGDAGQVTADFTVSVPPTGFPVSVDYATSGGSATSGTDFQPAAGTLSFPISDTVQTQTVSVSVDGDTDPESDETFTVALSNAVNGTIGHAAGLGTILDDDLDPVVSVSDASVAEGNAGTVAAVFAVTLSEPHGVNVTVRYAVAPGTATPGTDYVPATGTITFLAGETAKPVSVLVAGDTAGEADETFFLELAGATSATLGDARGVGTIADDDAPALALAIEDTQAVEPGLRLGSREAVFTVRLSARSAGAVSASYRTVNGTARSGLDYEAVAGTVSFRPGQLTQTIRVPLLPDRADEGNEAFLVRLGNPVGAALQKPLAQGVILEPATRRSHCIPIVYTPFRIRTGGSYCLVRNLSSSVSSGAAISIEASAVTLDLGGFTLRGTFGAGTFASGIAARNRAALVVRNGRIEGFQRGVFLDAAAASFTGARVERLAVEGSTRAGIWVEGRGNVVRGNIVSATGGSALFGADNEAYGIVSHGPAGRVLGNDVHGTVASGAAASYGILLLAADGTVAERNRVSAASFAAPSFGIAATSGRDVLMIGNRVSGVDAGLAFGSSHGRYRDNLTAGTTTPVVGGADAGNNE